MRKRFLFVSVVVFISLFTSSCSPEKKLVGKWICWDDGGIYFFGDSIIEFLSNDMVKDYDSGNTGGWSVVDGEVLIVATDSGDLYTFWYEIKGNMLTIVDEDYDMSVYQKTK